MTISLNHFINTLRAGRGIIAIYDYLQLQSLYIINSVSCIGAVVDKYSALRHIVIKDAIVGNGGASIIGSNTAVTIGNGGTYMIGKDTTIRYTTLIHVDDATSVIINDTAAYECVV